MGKIIAVILLMAGTAFSQVYYPTVVTKGVVADGDYAVFDGVSGRFIKSYSGTNIYTTMTNFVSIASSSNFLSYNPITRILSGCVTNGATGMPVYVESDPNWGAVSNDITGKAGHGDTAYGWGNHATNDYATGTPIYVESDPNWGAVSNVVTPNAASWPAVSNDITGKAGHGDTAYGWGNHATNDYATGTPLYVESDPNWGAVSNDITSKAGHGDTAYGWGNWSTNGLATGTPVYVESDPSWGAVSNDITSKAGHGDTAYGWGNHATNDYATGTPLYVESDPNWGAVSNVVTQNAASWPAVSNDITSKAGHGDTAYGWGNHATNDYATGTPLYVESDPNWAAVSNDITSKAGHGDTAYGWGNHATNDYATGTPLYVESDPNWGAVSNVVTPNAASWPAVSNDITSKAGNGDTAYGWGNHATNDYATGTPLYVESDPNWGAVSNDITGKAGHGDTAYGWGNHATNDYATGTPLYVESDPNWEAVSNVVTPNAASWPAVSNDITGKAGNGDTAYGWGNHATNDYATGTPLYVESDPNWGAVSNVVTPNAASWPAVSNDITGKAGHGDTAYGWGNHATNDYATGTPLYVESDPNWEAVSNVVTPNAASWPAVSNDITSKAGNGDTAYGWGNHATNDYATGTPLYVESDPNWGAVSNVVTPNAASWPAVSNDITSKAGHGDTAYGWGNHATNDYATGTPLYVESDPNWGAVSNDITGKAGYGDTAYGWGNHATNDYATGTPLYVESDPNWGTVSNQIQTNLNRIANEYPVLPGSANVTVTPTSTGQVISVTIGGVEYGTSDSTAYRGDWGAAVSNKAASALQSEVDPNWGAVSNDITSKAGHGDTAYGWGNHATNDYATGTPIYVESDPNWGAVSNVVTPNAASWPAVSNDITGNAGNGETAYGWGNHATNDYATGTPIYVESDPNWGAVSNDITGKAGHGDTAYGWGNHATNDYATGTPLYVESDPNWGAVSNDITGKAGYGDTAYGWGNHATNDYATGTPLYVESDPNWGTVSNQIQTNLNRIANEYPVLPGSANVTVTPTSTGQVISVTIGGVEYGTSDSTAYRGDWGAAVSNKAASALQSEVDPNWGAVSNDITGKAGHGDTAYGWGNHATNDYATGTPLYVESDPNWGTVSNIVVYTNTSTYTDAVAKASAALLKSGGTTTGGITNIYGYGMGTNLITMFGGVLNGTNGVYWTIGTNEYWMLFR